MFIFLYFLPDYKWLLTLHSLIFHAYLTEDVYSITDSINARPTGDNAVINCDNTNINYPIVNWIQYSYNARHKTLVMPMTVVHVLGRILRGCVHACTRLGKSKRYLEN
jgi:hypothetical protein